MKHKKVLLSLAYEFYSLEYMSILKGALSIDFLRSERKELRLIEIFLFHAYVTETVTKK